MTSERGRRMAAASLASPTGQIGQPLSAERAREMSAMRRTFAAGPGRPRSEDKPRCFCGEMTLIRALTRGHDCEEPGRKPRKEAS